MIGVVATLTIQDGKQAEFEAAMGALIAQVRAQEPGCTLYALTRKKGSTTTYVMMERYASQADLDAHGKTAYFQAAMPKLGACLAGPPQLDYLDVLI